MQRTRGAVGALAFDNLRGHGVGDHVLQDDADDDEKLRGDVKRVLAGEGDPAACRAGKNDEPGGDEARANIDIGATLRAEDRHRVGQLAEHHLDGPGQRQPDGDGSELSRREGQRFLDPERLGDGDEPKRAIGEIDHEQRQIAEPHGADRGENRRPQPVADVPPAALHGGWWVRRCRHVRRTVLPIFATLISVKA